MVKKIGFPIKKCKVYGFLGLFNKGLIKIILKLFFKI
jgi:hypothetical protein